MGKKYKMKLNLTNGETKETEFEIPEPVSKTMTGATAETDGDAGLVTKPKAGEQNMFLRGDGTWAASDKTLTKDGYAADAKVVGEKISETAKTVESKISVSAEIDEDGIASFKNAVGEVLFTLDLSWLCASVAYGNLVLSVDSLTVEEGNNGTFTVALDSAPSANQPVYLAVSDEIRLSVSPTTLTFTSENWDVPQTVTITALQDDDEDDNSITVTLTSKKVDAKQLLVNVTDDDITYDIITDGLILFADYTTWDGESTSIQDSINGVTINLKSGNFVKETNGIRGNGVAYSTCEIKRFDDAYAAFIEGYNKNQAISFEWFGNFLMPTTQGRVGGNNLTDLGITVSNAGGMSVSSKGGNISVNYYFIDTDGAQQKISASASFVYDDNRYADDFVHVVMTLSSDGLVTLHHNGVKRVATTAENFASWPVLNPTTDDTSAVIRYITSMINLGNNSSVAHVEGNWVSAQRIYNRVLTDEEINQNMLAEAQRLGLSTF